MISDSVTPEQLASMSVCPCGCCLERHDLISHGRLDPRCHCDIYPEYERCDCSHCDAQSNNKNDAKEHHQ